MQDVLVSVLVGLLSGSVVLNVQLLRQLRAERRHNDRLGLDLDRIGKDLDGIVQEQKRIDRSIVKQRADADQIKAALDEIQEDLEHLEGEAGSDE